MQVLNVNVSNFREIAQTIQAIITVLALIVGGFWFLQKRQKYPRAGIEHLISHRLIANDGVLLSIGVTIYNKGNVLLSLATGEIYVKQMLPPRAELFRLINENHDSVNKGTQLIEWDTVAFLQKSWKRGKLEIEPGESHQFYYHFVIGKNIQTVFVESLFQNVKKPYRQLYWRLATIYDIASM
jgi:hypothetical protein